MILTAIKNQASDKVALQTANLSINYGELADLVEQFSQWLEENKIYSVALSCDNSPQWVIVDLACQHCGVVFTAIPLFFSEPQITHLLDTAKPDLLLSDKKMLFGSEIHEPCLQLLAYRLPVQKKAVLPESTSKITYTSGSTGQPKGVCLSVENQLNVAQSLVQVIALPSTKHLCLLPLSTLLENIAGVYSPLLVGGCIYLFADSQRGFSGSRLVDPQRLLACIDKAQPNSLILVPELLQVLIQGAVNGWQVPASLQFIAVGGSKVTRNLLARARQLGFPVYQGYGLSECGSVVSLETAACRRSGSSGKLLPHLSASVVDNELVVKGNTFLGYLNQPDSWGKSAVYTGDIAQLADQEIFIKGRLKNLLINSFGRNISPEWIEAEMLASGLFQQFVVIGDSRPYCCALLVTRSKQIEDSALSQVITSVNQGLPDYAQIKAFIRLKKPMSYEAGLVTENGRPRRQNIVQHYAQQIEAIYLKEICE
ncbi:MAG: AMP-binding protein [Psychromonas sp.]|nr:AMP-binding protein [Psychromonas sp.]